MSSNTLWVNFMFVADDYTEQIEAVTQRIFQNLYILQPQLDGLLFLKRGQVESLEDMEGMYRILHSHFL